MHFDYRLTAIHKRSAVLTQLSVVTQSASFLELKLICSIGNKEPSMIFSNFMGIPRSWIVFSVNMLKAKQYFWGLHAETFTSK